ncbi:MAG: hypothetical protein U1D41_14300 [Nitrosomonas sp.]|uniref:hypothetical protein n=1 Tax=Nitrosomonas sp. TaxID=42353 RepID=UPI0027333A51|nr:hypothetical protein [Nitrosomonas sp.]MDP3282690.1 hypothetical protein [Nitrosomonas sp.]MDP3664981.1 hypothetical protein [Nitrosomonas sp.]MDZ4107298.1 hypothetical protein [Nitrosomonas sp.]
MTQRKKIQKCVDADCNEAPYLGGFCEKHHKEKLQMEKRRETALTALDAGKIADQFLENKELCDELQRLRQWWFKICDAINNNRKDTILKDEAKYAIEWCIALAQEIVDAELAFRAGSNRFSTDSLMSTRQWVWERFRNLEAGLMSNGIQRKSN